MSKESNETLAGKCRPIAINESAQIEDSVSRRSSIQLTEIIMIHDTDKIDKAVLALLQLGLHDGNRTWKTFDWDAMNRLYEKGLISNPVGRMKSVELTEQGMTESRRIFKDLFEV
jgi:hypothetical protein